ncbi:unnamed protein product [Ilex paraguariensis]|uniref:B box-type domain-containing protein n=1 Tax=Ilex paraguariensis TaxID=185542 RepID=A0ABC8RNJ5_9AQUA
MKKGCELCSLAARIYCDSDEASLCWDCDEKVHCANFLVAKHSRSLLCHVCQSPTPWQASGPKFGPTFSVCETCLHDRNGKQDRDQESRGNQDEEYDDLEFEDDSSTDNNTDGEDEEVDGGNQVVPWSPTPPRPAPSSSGTSNDEKYSSSRFSSQGGEAVSSFRRMPETKDLDSEHSIGSCSFGFNPTASQWL